MILVRNSYGANGVVGIGKAKSSLGRECHVRHVTPDRQCATVGIKKIIRFETWNVRNLYQAGKVENFEIEMDRLNVNIMRVREYQVCETRWLGAGKITSNEHLFIFSGEHHERGVGIIYNKQIANCNLSYWLVSERVLCVRQSGKPLNISLIQVYAPTTDADDDEMGKFYD